jgi:hypothetical protein
MRIARVAVSSDSRKSREERVESRHVRLDLCARLFRDQVGSEMKAPKVSGSAEDWHHSVECSRNKLHKGEVVGSVTYEQGVLVQCTSPRRDETDKLVGRVVGQRKLVDFLELVWILVRRTGRRRDKADKSMGRNRKLNEYLVDCRTASKTRSLRRRTKQWQ